MPAAENASWRVAPENDNGRAVSRPTAGFIYLASPYTKLDHDDAADAAAQCAAALMRRGLVVYSPVVHGHAVAACSLPLDWQFWKAQCQPMIDAADSMIVVQMEGWAESVGVQYEIGEFRRAGKPIVFASVGDILHGEASGRLTERRAA